MRLQGKIALIVGDGAEVGHAITLGFAREGADIVLADYELGRVREGKENSGAR